MVENLVQIELSYINTKHPDFHEVHRLQKALSNGELEKSFEKTTLNSTINQGNQSSLSAPTKANNNVGPIASAANSFLFNNATKNYQTNSSASTNNQSSNAATSSNQANQSSSNATTPISNGINLRPDIVSI